MPKMLSEPADFISVGQNEVRVENAGWTVCIDAPLCLARRAELEHDTKRMIARLQHRVSTKLDRGFFEALFGGHFVAIAHDRNQGRTYVLRDVAGAKTIYHASDDKNLVAGNVQSEVAQALPKAQISAHSARMMMVLDHYLDGDTQYSQVAEVQMGTILASRR